MFSSIARSVRLQQHKKLFPLATVRFQQPAAVSTTAPRCASRRWFAAAATVDPQSFQPTPPTAITQDMAENIQDTTLFYLRHGVSNQRLHALCKDTESPLVLKWQRMMEIYLSTQVFVISGLGYPGNEKGLEEYTRHLQQYIQSCNDDTKEMYRKVGNETWRELLATAFDLNLEQIESLSIVEARNIMHKISSKMQEPEILMKIQKECSKIPSSKFFS